MEFFGGLLAIAIGAWLVAAAMAIATVLVIVFIWVFGRFMRWCTTVTYRPRR